MCGQGYGVIYGTQRIVMLSLITAAGREAHLKKGRKGKGRKRKARERKETKDYIM